MACFTLDTKWKHHANRNRAIFLGQFGSAGDQLGIEIRGDVFADNLAFTHFIPGPVLVHQKAMMNSRKGSCRF